MKSPETKSEYESNLLLRASPKRLFESLMEQTADRIYIKDRKSRFVAVSSSLASMHGFSNRHDLEGKTDFDLFSIEHAQQAFDDEQTIIRTGEALVNRVEKETWPDGSVTWVSSSKAPLYLSSGKLVGIIGISRDITTEKLTQEKIAQSEHQLREQNEVMRSDYESANKVQRIMIPGRVPVTPKLDLAYLWKPMTSVGGDIINFPRNPANLLLFFLGDVCGHGVSAAFYTVLLKYVTAHAAEVYAEDPRQFLNSVNEQVIGHINNGFVTGLAGHFGPLRADGGRELFLAHAGHRQVLVFRKQEKKMETIDLGNGTVLGVPGCSASGVSRLRLHRGDRFYAFTDGIVEASDPEGNEFSLERLVQLLESLHNLSLQKGLETTFATVSKFTQQPGQQDDISLLSFELL